MQIYIFNMKNYFLISAMTLNCNRSDDISINQYSLQFEVSSNKT